MGSRAWRPNCFVSVLRFLPNESRQLLTRSGAAEGGRRVRFRQPGGGSYYSAHRNAVPRLIEVARLLRAAERLEAEGTFDRDIADLIDAGSSLGGARPKAAITDASGRLTIAKFPRSSSDEWDAPAWEGVQLRLARRAGLSVTASELLPIAGRHSLLVDRFVGQRLLSPFDRRGAHGRRRRRAGDIALAT